MTVPVPKPIHPMRLRRPRIMKHPMPAWHHGPWQLSVPLKNPSGVGRRYFNSWHEACDELVLCYGDPGRWPDSDLKGSP